MKSTFDARAWVLWLLAASIIILLTRNPFYLLILLLIARVVLISCAIPHGGVRIRFWRLAAIIITFSTLFNLLLVHFGDTVLLTLPSSWWILGGRLTLEAAIYGAINGLILVALLAVFLTFNGVVPASELIRLAPRALTNLGLVTMIALTYVPETVAQLQRIREAQALRGHRLHGLRDWQPIVIPLLVGGLERAMGLAETMVARGYGSTTDTRQSLGMQLGLLATLMLSLAGWLVTFWIDWLGWTIVGVGLALLVVLGMWLGRQVSHTRYRPRAWTKRDTLLVLCSLVPLALLTIPSQWLDRSDLFYTPYTRAALPTFNVWLGLSLTLLAAPAILVEL